jgi:hypothetical protein
MIQVHIINNIIQHLDELQFWIHRWLSGSDLKKIALFGCPSLEKKNVFAAKRLRKFFEIQENTVSQFPIAFHLISLAFFLTLVFKVRIIMFVGVQIFCSSSGL